jgi:hypothetical protein
MFCSRRYSGVDSFCSSLFRLLWKESLNCDGLQFHQYQENKQSAPTFSLNPKIKNTTYDVKNPGRGLEQLQECQKVKPVNGIITLA